MRKLLTIAVLFIALGSVKAQNRVLWKNNNAILEQTVDNETGESIYTLFSKEVKYQYMYYLLSVSEGSLQDVANDISYYGNLCNEKEGLSKSYKGKRLLTRDAKSVFVVVEGDFGFAMISQKEVKKIKKILNKKAVEIGVELEQKSMTASNSLQSNKK